MTHAISPNARKAQDGISSADDEVALIRIRHNRIDTLYLASVGHEVISYEPYMLGIKSTWLADQGQTNTFQMIAMGVDKPDDVTDAPMQAALVLDILDSKIADILTSTIEPALVDMAVVMRSSPDFIERQFLDLEMETSEGDGGSVAMTFGKKRMIEEACPCDRTTKERFPGLRA